MVQSNETNPISRWWRAVIEASATAVAIHYDAPWKRPTT
jgi:hypothetical protein